MSAHTPTVSAETPTGDQALAPRSVESRRYFRTDVEGMRAVAVLVVVLYHAGVPLLTGGFVGVDVFFVISGYLITGLLLREAQQTGRISFPHFFARRARRILPPATLVLIATMTATVLIDPVLNIYNTSRAVLAAGLYMANWYFIGQGTDYFAQSTSSSPVLHYWSLAVEEQFYIVWPLLILAAVVLARRFPMHTSRIIAGTVGIVTVVSLIASIVVTDADMATAYMSTFTRGWELGLGALIATIGHWLQARDTRPGYRALGIALGWAGLAAVVVAVFVYTDATPFPGSAALLPVLGAGGMIAGGLLVPHARGAVGSILSLRPVRYIGRLSFGWYLWHWPLLVIAHDVVGELSWQENLIVVAVGLMLAAAMLHLFELPIGRWKQVARQATPAIAMGLLCMVLSTTFALTAGSRAVATLASSTTTTTADAATFSKVFGADTGRNSGSVTPNPLEASKDAPGPAGCLLDKEIGKTVSCETGVPLAKATKTIALFGDSHAHQWLPALQAIAKERSWHITVFTKAGCPAADIIPRGDGSRLSSAECVDWRHRSEQYIVQTLKPDMIVTSSLHTYLPASSTQEMLTAWDTTLNVLRQAAVPIVYIRDTPHPDGDVPTCVSGAFDDWSKCAFATDGIEEPVVQKSITGGEKDVTVVDPLPYLCEKGECDAVKNGVLLYRDDSHISATASTALSAWLETSLEKAKLIGTQG